MTLVRAVSTASAIWIFAITLLHAWLNLGVFAERRSGPAFRVGFLPVT